LIRALSVQIEIQRFGANCVVVQFYSPSITGLEILGSFHMPSRWDNDAYR